MPVRDKSGRSSAANRGSARTDKGSLPCSSSSERKTGRENALADRAGPYQPQTFRRPDKRNASRGQLQRSELAADQPVGLIPVEIFDAFDLSAKLSQHAVLHLTALQRGRVGNAMECDHCILRNKQLWKLCFQGKLDLLTKQESRISDAISHLYKVFDCHIRDRIGVDFASIFKFRKNALPVRSMPVQQVEKAGAIFKAAIDSLAEERNNRMGRVPQQKRAAFYVPGRTFDCHHRASWIRKKIGCQVGHQWNGIRKSRLKELKQRCRRCQLRETVRPLKRQKKDAGKRAVNVG